MKSGSGNITTISGKRTGKSRFYSVLALLLFLGTGVSLLTALPALTKDASASSSAQVATKGLPPESPASPECGPGWAVVTGATIPSQDNVLNAETAISSSDVWSVGYYYSDNHKRTLIEHWNGSAWSAVASPNSGTDDELKGVAAVSSTDIWAVGDYLDSGGNARTTTEHWDGSTWSVVSSPNPGTYDDELNAVTAVSSSDVWAVGYHEAPSGTLIEHWDGSTWSVVSSPTPLDEQSPTLNGIAALSSTSIWAVGSYTWEGIQYALIEHWDGSAWSVVYGDYEVEEGSLYGVTAISASNVWAVGFYGGSMPLIVHWNGTSWNQVSCPHVGTNYNELLGVASISSTNMWAAGYYLDDSNASHTLTEHWDGSSWSVVSSPNIGPIGSALHGIAALSSSNVLAVGDYLDTASKEQTLAEHWDGSQWSAVVSPNLGGGNHVHLKGVAAISSSDVWAVGDYSDGLNTERTLTEHWNGSVWSLVSSPNLSGYSYLYGVSAKSSNDVWVVGYYYNNSIEHTLIEHWNGSNWSVVASPNPGASTNVLNGVAAISSSDVWAVGYYVNSSSLDQTLVEHWNGSAWSVFTSPNTGIASNQLDAVSAVSSSDVWAVGYYYTSGTPQTLTEHWNGSNWSVVDSPPLGGANYFYGVAAISSSDVWAVGDSSGGQLDLTLVEHWNGSQWSVVNSPNPNLHNDLYAVAAISSNDIWAVGNFSQNGLMPQTLTAHWNGSQWSVASSSNVGTDNVLYGVAAVSNSDVWAAGDSDNATLIEHYDPCPGSTTPTPLPTQCALQFEDVPNPSTFYAYIQCLACRGIISGYACGGPNEPCNPDNDPYFRPGADVTRGQIAKILVRAAGINNSVSGQSFEDVPPGSTFYTYTEELYALGVISGFHCGGVGEPCVPPANRPYFRPGAKTTRGQLAKIDAKTAGFNDPPGAQMFQDVPVGSTFYTYTQRLASRGVMGGYACGGQAEPCVPPGNLPYFRPNADVKRGQTSKIVANTFYPNCQAP